MSNALYGKGRDKFMNGSINWVSDTIKSVLIDTADYTVSIDADEFVDEIAAAAKVSESALAGKSSALGVADANDTVHAAVTGDSVEAIVIYKDTGTPATSPLIAYIDSATGLPLTPNGGDVTISWDSGANKIFKL